MSAPSMPMGVPCTPSRRDRFDMRARARTTGRRLLAPLAATVLAILVAGGVWSSGVLEQVESDSVDARFMLRDPPAPKGIVVAEIDDKSIDELGVWPLSRRLHAKAVDRLHDAGARLIVYDVQFTEASPDLDADFALYDAIGNAGGAVLATSTSDAKGRTEVLGGDDSLAEIDSQA